MGTRVAGAGGLGLIAIGLIWLLQGIGVLEGSPMTDQSFWAYAGVVMIAAGVAIRVWYHRRRRRLTAPPAAE